MCCCVCGAGTDGGDPIVLDGNIYLCGRVDNHPERHFDGSIAKLSLFDVALEAEQASPTEVLMWPIRIISADFLE